jgi:hypothetical protein
VSEASQAERTDLDTDVPASTESDVPVEQPGASEAPTPASTDPRVDDALSRLAEIDGLPLAEQVQVYTDIHRRLAGVLADPDSQA